jgi:transcriptional regulator with XRE-family HTH domain
MLTEMDDQRVGWMLRAIRIKKRWRQVDLAAKARVSRWVVMRIEQGRLSSVPLGKLRAVAAALDARIDAVVRWHGGDLPRLLSARHSGMHEAMARYLQRLPAWIVEPEVSFSIYGERGVIDILAWHPTSRMLLVIELKTEIIDLNELLGTLDRKRRLAWTVARHRGWDPVGISSWDVVADSRTNRRAVATHSAVDPQMAGRPSSPDQRPEFHATCARGAPWSRPGACSSGHTARAALTLERSKHGIPVGCRAAIDRCPIEPTGLVPRCT